MPELMVLQCPVCGAPFSPGDTQCAFCGSAIVIKADMPTLNLKTLNQTVIQEHIVDFRARIRRDPYDVEAHYGLGMAYYSLRLGDEAIEELTQAAKLMPENADIQAQLAIVLHRAVISGKRSAEQPMQERLAKALTLDPDHVDANLLRAELLQQQGDHARALSILDSLRQTDGSRTDAKRADSLDVLARQALSRGDRAAFAQAIGSLRAIDDQRTRALVMVSIQQHRDDLDSAVMIAPGGGDARMVEDLGDKAVSWLKTILVGVGVLVAGLIVLMIYAVMAPTGADGDPTTVASLIFLALGLLYLASPFVAGWVYRRRTRRRQTAWDDRLGRRVSRDDILGGRLSTDDLVAVERLLSSGGRVFAPNAIR